MNICCWISIKFLSDKQLNLAKCTVLILDQAKQIPIQYEEE